MKKLLLSFILLIPTFSVGIPSKKTNSSRFSWQDTKPRPVSRTHTIHNSTGGTITVTLRTQDGYKTIIDGTGFLDTN